MNTKDLIRLGVPVGEPIRTRARVHPELHRAGQDGALLEAEIFNIVANPPAFFADELRAPLSRAIYRPAFTPRTNCRSGGYAVSAPRLAGRRCRAVRSRRGVSGARGSKPRR